MPPDQATLADHALPPSHALDVTERYRGKQWRDMSHFLVHYTADLGTLTSILDSMTIVPGTGERGYARQEGFGRPAISLSEIPPDDHSRLQDQHGDYGLAFHVDSLQWSADQMKIVFGRVWYVEKDSEHARHLWRLAFLLSERLELGPEFDEAAQRFAEVSPLIDQLGTYTGGVHRRFEWEREWRWIGHLPFAEHELRFIVAPDPDHPHIASMFPGIPLVVPDAPFTEIQAAEAQSSGTGHSRGWNPVRHPADLRMWHNGGEWEPRARTANAPFDLFGTTS